MKAVLLTTAVSIVALSGCVSQQARMSSTYFDDWPEHAWPVTVGKRVAERFVASPHPNFGFKSPPNDITYPESCAWYGALTFADLSGNTDLTERLIKRFEPLFGPELRLIPKPGHVDPTVFGSVPLEIYMQTGLSPYRHMGLYFADKQWENPTPEGLTPQTRFWIDDMYMITMIQSQAYRATGDAKYIERAALEMTVYLDKLQQPNGLFYHAPDVPFYWGRGNGWMAAGLTEMLRSLPQDNIHRPRIMQGYQTMMATLLKYQTEDGMWRQLIDNPDAWPETSCTGMFTFAMVTGVKNGWLDPETYGPAARKGWLALVSYIDENADVRDVCEGTNKKNSLEYYLNRGRKVGDMHGQAPVLWCASALLR